MGIADDIIYVSKEFVDGGTLVNALAKQEGVKAYQAASWLIRHYSKLEKLDMIEYDRSRKDFRIAEVNWSFEVLYELLNENEDVDWLAEPSYEGGWLAPDLQDFFKDTNISYPGKEISALMGNGESDGSEASSKILGGNRSSNSLGSFGAFKEVGTKERATLLTIIAALVEEAKISLLTPSKSADLISEITLRMGSPVAKRTIEEHLKKVPDALERKRR